ncbi:MAG: EAL domain-containing protein [Oleiphilaceae bacterium]|nr:EAL domain-containing protein [Oleiphilaceae bacterium]
MLNTQRVTLDQQIVQLRRDYLASLPGHARMIHEAWRMLTHVCWEDRTLEKLQKVAHLLAGSGGSFGFNALTETGRALAQALEDQRQTRSKVSLAQRTRLEKAVQALLKEIERILNVPSRDNHAEFDAATSAKLAILDEDPIQGQHLKLLCEAFGYEVSWYTSLPLLSDHAREHNYELILADPLPYPSVTDLMQEVHGRLPMPVPVLMLSARTDISSRLEALRAGVSGYMTRPVSKNPLRQEISRLVSSNRFVCPKVLLVDNQKVRAAQYQQPLEQNGFDLRILSKPMTLLDVLERHAPDILLINNDMTDIHAPELARLLQQDNRYQQLPVVFITSHSDELRGDSSMTLAGDDWLISPVSDRLLVDTLRRRLARTRQLTLNLQRINGNQTGDGLQNRALFLQQLETDLAAWRMNKRRGEELLLYLSTDKLELLRHQHGVLGCANLGSLIEQWLADQPAVAGRGSALSDLVWLVRIRVKKDDSAENLVAQLREQLSKTAFTLDGNALTLDFSAVGVVLNGQLPDAAHVVDELEKACFRVIEGGGGDSVITSLTSPSRPPLSERLKKALVARRFVLQYQPVMNLETNQNHFQALVRLQDEEGNLFLPEEFMASVPDYLEDGLPGLDRWVVETALSALDSNLDTQTQVRSVIIKFSGDIKSLPFMLSFMTQLMQKVHLREGRQLYFAFQERYVIKHLDRIRPFMERLSQMNVGIVVEHFAASGHGQLLLKELPLIDYVRLDGNWNERVHDKEEVSALMEVLNRRFAGLERVIACRVEEAKTFSAFWNMGIRHFQGHFVQQPGDLMLLE